METSIDTSERSVLVVGDVHGHLDRLEALLKQEGIIGTCSHCDGLGEILGREVPNESSQGSGPAHQLLDCERCDGDGITRVNHDVTVVQLGDLGHFGGSTGSPTGDMMTYNFARKGWVDIILWGNHDRAVFDQGHIFGGYFPPNYETQHMMKSLVAEGRYRLAYAAHGFLLTHAGLHLAFRDNDVDPKLKEDPEVFAEWVNQLSDPAYLPKFTDENRQEIRNLMGVVNSISTRRGGSSRYGGILWRDISEKLYMGFRQVFGHSASRDATVQYVWEKGHTGKPEACENNKPEQGWSYCVDLGGRDNGLLAGIWLPDERIVQVKV